MSWSSSRVWRGARALVPPKETSTSRRSALRCETDLSMCNPFSYFQANWPVCQQSNDRIEVIRRPVDGPDEAYQGSSSRPPTPCPVASQLPLSPRSLCCGQVTIRERGAPASLFESDDVVAERVGSFREREREREGEGDAEADAERFGDVGYASRLATYCAAMSSWRRGRLRRSRRILTCRWRRSAPDRLSRVVRALDVSVLACDDSRIATSITSMATIAMMKSVTSKPLLSAEPSRPGGAPDNPVRAPNIVSTRREIPGGREPRRRTVPTGVGSRPYLLLEGVRS